MIIIFGYRIEAIIENDIKQKVEEKEKQRKDRSFRVIVGDPVCIVCLQGMTD